MPIYFYPEKKLFKLDTAESSYIFKVYQENYLVHLYYGRKIPDTNLTKFDDRCVNASFSARNANWGEAGPSIDSMPMEYGCNGCGDMRITGLQVRNADGNASTDIRYISHNIYSGKPKIPGLPALSCALRLRRRACASIRPGRG